MPFGDGTGPKGEGPGTGRGLGKCRGGKGGDMGGGDGPGGRRNISVNWQPQEKKNSEKEEGNMDKKAKIDKEECTGCEACIPVCPNEAVTVDDVAIIDEEKCNGCGECVDICPMEAISLN
ncbi:4Fe-4S binding protein [Elusimicrobiota bacterium]